MEVVENVYVTVNSLSPIYFHNFCYVLFKCIFGFINQWVLLVVYALYYMA